MLTIALPTGRVFADAAGIIEASGLPCSGLSSPGRKLVIEDGDFRYILAKPSTSPCM